MKHANRLLALIGLMFLSFVVHAEGGCPPGMIPYSGTDISSCGPIPPNQGQQAPPIRWETRWGAIATDSKYGSTGVSTGLPSKQAAEQAAIADCELRMKNAICEIEVAYDNKCVAMISGDHEYNTSINDTEAQAVAEGMKVCRDAKVSNCHVYYSGCSLPLQVQ